MGSHIPFGKGDAWLRAARSIWLATGSPSGRPHSVPVWFVWDGHSIYFCTGPTTVKHRNLQQQSWLIAHLGDGDDTLILEGHAVVVLDADELGTIDRLFRGKYVDPRTGATVGYPQSAADVPYRIDIERIMIWEYGIVATRTDFIPRRRHRDGPSIRWIVTSRTLGLAAVLADALDRSLSASTLRPGQAIKWIFGATRRAPLHPASEPEAS